jgi:GT2 family glycosyltransferase
MTTTQELIASVVVLNYNGKAFLDDCFGSLEDQSLERDRFEIIMVDNGSSDGSVAHVRSAWPKVRVVAQSRNLGFAGGNNVGAKAARGRYIAFINNDARAHPDWLVEGLRPMRKSADIGAVASKILSLDGTTIDFAGGAASFYGHAFKVGREETDQGSYDRTSETLFASGCAMLIDAELFSKAGGFDEDFFAFFEDVDLGWRLWLLGYRVLYVPSSLVFHRHHGTIERFGYEKERFLLERNALLTIVKNYDDENLGKVLPAALWLAVERGLRFSSIDRSRYDLASGNDIPAEAESLSTLSAAHLLAISEAGRKLGVTLEKREVIQSLRVRSDRELAYLFRQPLLPNDESPEFLELFQKLVGTLQIDRLFSPFSKVLILTGDRVSTRMAGPAIRAWEMARYLSRNHEVRLLARYISEPLESTFEIDLLNRDNLRSNSEWADVIIFQGFILRLYPEIAKAPGVLVADVYDPFHLENLEVLSEDGMRLTDREEIAESDLSVINEQLALCDYFICASEKQRDFWLGQLGSLGRINLKTYGRDPTMRQLVDVVPFGIQEDPPVHRSQVLKDAVPGIGSQDKVILWGGGVYNWFDPLTLIKAIDLIKDEHPEVRLYFLGMSHPNPDVPAMKMAAETLALARDLGLENRQVFFNHGWVPYEERANYLTEADIGVSSHLSHVETTFSYRTRVLDYFWAGLPVIVTRGDAMSELVERHGLGLTVEAEDVEGFANALSKMLEDSDFVRECKLNIDKIRPDLSWSKVLEPLDEFCRRPSRAPDRQSREEVEITGTGRRGLLWGARRLTHYWRKGGFTLARTQLRKYLAARRARAGLRL